MATTPTNPDALLRTAPRNKYGKDAENRARIWSGIILIPSNQNFHDPASPVLIAIKTWLRLANPDGSK